jgi:hypothetical protein
MTEPLEAIEITKIYATKNTKGLAMKDTKIFVA